MLRQERESDGELLPSDSFREAIVTWLLQDVFSYRDDKSEVARYCDEVSLPQANSSGAIPTSPDYYVDVRGEANWYLAELNAVDEPSRRIVWTTEFTELQDACRRADVFASSSRKDVLYFARGPVSALVTSEISFSGAL